MNAITQKICSLIQSSNRETQHAAIRVLIELGPKEAGFAKQIGENLQKTTDPAAKELLLTLIAKQPAKEYLPYLISILEDFQINKDRLIFALSALGAVAIPELVKRYPKANEYERKIILSIFSKIHQPKSMNLLLKALFDSRDLEHLKFITSLFRSSIPDMSKGELAQFKQQLVQFYQSENTQKTKPVLISAIIIMGYLKDASLIDLLIKAANSFEDTTIKRFALLSIQQISFVAKDNEGIVRGLFPLLKHSDYPNVVKNTIDILQRCEIGKKHEKLLQSFLESEHGSVRGFVLSKMGNFDSKDNISILLKHLDSSDYKTREAARYSLSNSETAGKTLLLEFEKSKDRQRIELLSGILKNHKKIFTTVVCKRIWAKNIKRPAEEADIRSTVFNLIRTVNPDYIFAATLADYKKYKTKRDWLNAANCLKRLDGTGLLTADMKIELAVCKLLASKLDLAIGCREKDEALFLFQSLIKTHGISLLDKLKSEKALSAKHLYYLGFNFSEKHYDLREFGTRVLEFLARSKKDKKTAALAKRKLDSAGLVPVTV